MQTDPIADMLTRIRNANKALQEEVRMATGDGRVTRRRFGKWAATGLGAAAVTCAAGYATFEAIGQRDKRLRLKNASAQDVTGANSLGDNPSLQIHFGFRRLRCGAIRVDGRKMAEAGPRPRRRAAGRRRRRA